MSTSDMTDTPAVRRPPPGDVATLTAMEGLAALERGALSCEAWTRACLERIEQRNGQVQAWVQVDAHGAGARRAWDRHGRQRLLDGVPLGIKDTIDTADLPTELGDPEIFPGRQPDADAPWSARRARWVSMCWARIRYRVTQSCCPDRRAIRMT